MLGFTLKGNGEPLKRVKQMNDRFPFKKVTPDGHNQLDLGRPFAHYTTYIVDQDGGIEQVDELEICFGNLIDKVFSGLGVGLR